MIKTCTWVGCAHAAIVPQLDRNGKEWANLCSEHDKILDASIGLDMKQMMANWIKAQGGAAKAAKKMGAESGGG